MEEPARIAGTLLLVVACATGCGDGRAEPAGGGACDVVELFSRRCAGSGCHEGAAPAAGLDLLSPGLEARVSFAPAVQCGGLLADPSDPEGSLLFQKIAGAPACGGPMPLGRPPLSAAEVTCVRDWISGLLPPCTDCVCEPGATQPCYEGPPATEGVGRCRAGTTSCAFDGRSAGPCDGQQLPLRESCLTADVDEDCDGQRPPCSERWSVGFGGAGVQAARSVAVDAAGGVFVAGDFEGAVSAGGAPLSSDGPKSDLFLAKYDRFGDHLWARRFGDSSNQFASQLVVDDGGGVVLLGRGFGRVDFGGGPLGGAGGQDVFVASLDGDGNHRWSRALGGPEEDRAERLTIDGAGRVWITGAFSGELDSGAGGLVSAGLRDLFVVALDGATGETRVARRFGGAGDDYGFGIGADAQGTLFVTGRFQRTMSLGRSLSSAGGYDVFLARLSGQGAPLWGRAFGGGGFDGADDLVVHRPSGDVIIAGVFSTSIDLGGGRLESAGSRDLFVARFGGGGAPRFSARFGDGVDQRETFYETNSWGALDLDATGGLLLAGPLSGSARFGDVTLSSAGASDLFVVRLSPGGAVLAGRTFGTAGIEIGLDVAAAPGGGVVLAGRLFGAAVDFGAAGAVAGEAAGDGFAAVVDP